MNYVQQFVDACGGAAKVAAGFSITPEAVYQWIAGGSVPQARVIEAFKMCGGKVSPHQLCPSRFPDLDYSSLLSQQADTTEVAA